MTIKNITDLYWVAGILEGEGSFQTNSNGRVVLKMTDEDIMIRAAKILGVKKLVKVLPKNKKHKVCFEFRISGKKTEDIIKSIYPIMGDRRKKQINRIINRGI